MVNLLAQADKLVIGKLPGFAVAVDLSAEHHGTNQDCQCLSNKYHVSNVSFKPEWQL
jgi:hypothetical protein